MTLGQLLILYLMAGSGVATAVYLTASPRGLGQRWFQVISALAFWPLYLPLLLSRTEPGQESASARVSLPPPADELTQAIVQVDAELEGALHSLDGWAEDVLAREKDRLDELRSAWSTQAQRIRDMDRLLSRPEYLALIAAPPENGTSHALAVRDSWLLPPDIVADSQRMRNSRQAMRDNLARLKQVRERTYQDLLETLAWVRELVSMIHLAKFTGAPASRAEELVAQIAAAVEGLSALTWQEDEEATP